MRLFSLAAMMALTLLLVFVTEDADALQKKKKKAAAITGTVTNVERGKDGAGSITVQPKKKKKATDAPKAIKLEITKETKFEKGAGKKKDKTPPVSSDFAAVENGQQVSALLRAGSESVAEKVTISTAKKKKKKTQEE